MLITNIQNKNGKFLKKDIESTSSYVTWKSVEFSTQEVENPDRELLERMESAKDDKNCVALPLLLHEG